MAYNTILHETTHPSKLFITLDSLAIKCEVSHELSIYTETFFNAETGKLLETAVNVFKEKQLIFSGSGDTEKMIAKIEEAIS